MPNATHNPELHQSPDEGRATYISRRPAWADETRVDPEAILHTWRSPTVAMGADDHGGGKTYPIPVEILQYDDLTVFPSGVSVERGEPVIFLSDLFIQDTENGRKLAAAILEACDRLDGAR
jgi:hypothetical protein